MKSWKTTFTAIAGGLSLIAVAALTWFKIITAEQAGILLGAIGSFVGVIVGLLAKDYNATGKP